MIVPHSNKIWVNFSFSGAKTQQPSYVRAVRRSPAMPRVCASLQIIRNYENFGEINICDAWKTVLMSVQRRNFFYCRTRTTGSRGFYVASRRWSPSKLYTVHRRLFFAARPEFFADRTYRQERKPGPWGTNTVSMYSVVSVAFLGPEARCDPFTTDLSVDIRVKRAKSRTANKHAGLEIEWKS
jgi:hypothetical protein